MVATLTRARPGNVTTRRGTARRRTLTPDDRALLKQFNRLCDVIRMRIRGVAEGYHNGCYIVGSPGSSKTFTIEKELRRLGKPWVIRNCRMTPLGLWTLLEEHPKHIIVLDDLQNLLVDPASLQILMAALGGRPGEPRTVTYTTKGADGSRSAVFSGGIIIVSNVPPGQNPLAQAVTSRVPPLVHEPSDEMIAAFIRHQALRGQQGLTPAQALEVAEFVIAESRACGRRLDLRAAEKGWGDFLLCKSGPPLCDWKQLVRSSLKQTVSDGSGRPVSVAERKDRDRQVARAVFAEFPRHCDKGRRDEEWAKRTGGKSVDTLYRRKRELDAEGRP